MAVLPDMATFLWKDRSTTTMVDGFQFVAGRKGSGPEKREVLTVNQYDLLTRDRFLTNCGRRWRGNPMDVQFESEMFS